MRNPHDDAIQAILERAEIVEPERRFEIDSIDDLPANHWIFQIAAEQPQNPDYIPSGVSFPHFRREERELIVEVMRENPDAGYFQTGANFLPVWQPRFPFPLNGQPDEVMRRRVYNNRFFPCAECGGRNAIWLDRYELSCGIYCEKCHTDTLIDSWAAYQWRRRPVQAIESTFDGFIANDPLLADVDIWHPNKLFHLGSGMGTGKTTYIFQCADKLAQADPDARVVYLTARISQTRGIYAAVTPDRTDDYRQEITDEDVAWGLFHEGSPKDDKIIGFQGAIATIPSLKNVIARCVEQGIESRNLHLVIDEVDFATNLMNSQIMKEMKKENKLYLREVIANHGIVVAGQTENLLTLEGFAKELDIAPEDITGYYKRGNVGDASLTIYEYPHEDGMKAMQIAGVVQRCEEVMKAGKRPYVQCQGRRTAQIIAAHFKGALLYDAYERGTKPNEHLLYRQRTDASVVVTSCAVDVGISFTDPDGYSITVVDQNVRYLNGPASSVQQMVRDRNPSSREVHIISFENRLPVSPSFLEETGKRDMGRKLNPDVDDADDEERVVDHLSARKALDELSDVQFTEYITYQMSQAGFEVEKAEIGDIDVDAVARVRELKKAIVEAEKTAANSRAKSIVDEEASHWTAFVDMASIEGVQDLRPVPEHEAEDGATLTKFNAPMASDDIRRRGTRNQLIPSPTEQLAHERAWQACMAVGFKPLSGWEMREMEEMNAAIEEAHGGDVQIREKEFDELYGNRPLNMLSEQQGVAKEFLDSDIDYEEFRQQKLGYLAVHHESVIREIYKSERHETTHRTDYRRVGYMLQKLLHHIPHDEVMDAATLCRATRTAIEEHYGDDMLLDMLKEGDLNTTNATKFRFYQHDEPLLTAEGELSASAQRLVDWVVEFLPKHYPIRFSHRNENYQVVRESDWNIKLDCIECTLKYRHQMTDVTPKRQELIPSRAETGDFTPELTMQVRKMWTEGRTIVQITEELGVSRDFVKKRTKGMERPPKPESLDARILELMKDGEIRSRKQIATALDAKDRSVMASLNRLIKNQHIEKFAYGKYRNLLS